MSDHKGLIVWQRSMKLVKTIYGATQKFPKEEVYALTNQIRRAVVSVPSNLAEGRAMRTTPHYIKFIYIARGSLAELETQIIIARELGYMTPAVCGPIEKEIDEISRMLGKMLSGLNKRMEMDKMIYEYETMMSSKTDAPRPSPLAP